MDKSRLQHQSLATACQVSTLLTFPEVGRQEEARHKWWWNDWFGNGRDWGRSVDGTVDVAFLWCFEKSPGQKTWELVMTVMHEHLHFWQLKFCETFNERINKSMVDSGQSIIPHRICTFRTAESSREKWNVKLFYTLWSFRDLIKKLYALLIHKKM